MSESGRTTILRECPRCKQWTRVRSDETAMAVGCAACGWPGLDKRLFRCFPILEKLERERGEARADAAQLRRIIKEAALAAKEAGA